MSYQMEFRAKGDTSWVPWAEQYPSLEALRDDWGYGDGLNTDSFDFRIVRKP